MNPKPNYSLHSKKAHGLFIPLILMVLVILFVISLGRWPIVITIVLGLLVLTALLGVIFGSRMHRAKQLASDAIAGALKAGDRKKILDIGTGAGILAIHLTKRGFETYGIDSDPEVLQKAKDNAALELSAGQAAAHIDSHGMAAQAERDRTEAALRESERRYRLEQMFRVGDGSSLPWPDGTFDGVVSLNLLHETKDPGQVLKEAHRVLKPGGILAMADMRRGLAVFTIFWVGLIKFLTRGKLHRLAQEAGFMDIDISRPTMIHHLVVAKRP